MAIKYKVHCKTCQMSKANPKLRERLYKAAFRREDGDETLADIANDTGLSMPRVYNHAKKHMSEKKPTGAVITTRRIEEVKQAVAKELEVSLDHDSIVPRQDFEMALDTVIAAGLAELNAGTTKTTISQLLTASKIKSDYFGKKRGQDVELVKTMYRSMNGLKGATEEPGQLVEGGAQ
jgi:hypothetical protein